MKEIKKVVLIGMGAMGSFFAPGLFRALGDGFRVMAGGERRKRLERGVTINGVHHVFPMVEPEEQDGPADLVIIAVKDYALDEALEQIANQVGPETMLMPVLNGLTCRQRTAAVYGVERVLWASMWIAVHMRDGVAEFDPKAGLVRFGEARNDPPSQRVQAVEALFRAGDIPCRVEADMDQYIWRKFMGNVSENLTCALLGVPYGAFHVSDDANAIRRAAMEEVVAVARAAGVELTERDMDFRDQRVAGFSAAGRPSTLQDLDQGRRTEIDLFAGDMVRLGREYGVPTPVCRLFLHGIRVLEEKNAGKIPGM